MGCQWRPVDAHKHGLGWRSEPCWKQCHQRRRLFHRRHHAGLSGPRGLYPDPQCRRFQFDRPDESRRRHSGAELSPSVQHQHHLCHQRGNGSVLLEPRRGQPGCQPSLPLHQRLCCARRRSPGAQQRHARHQWHPHRRRASHEHQSAALRRRHFGKPERDRHQ